MELIVGEIYVEQLNQKNGLLGRPVEWIVKDDQSKPDLARTLYEQLLTVDKVDLVIGPYATPNIVSAMGVAQRYNKMLVHHTMGIPGLAKYGMQFPAWSVGPNPETTVPNTVLDALATVPKPPKTIAIVTSKFPSVHFLATGSRPVFKQRGLQEVLFLEFEFGTTSSRSWLMRAAFSALPVLHARAKSSIDSLGARTSSMTVFIIPPRNLALEVSDKLVYVFEWIAAFLCGKVPVIPFAGLVIETNNAHTIHHICKPVLELMG